MRPGAPERLAAWVESWACRSGTPVVRGTGSRPHRPTATPSNRVAVVNLDPRTDFGRYLYRTPACVLEPRTQEELVECVRRLGAARVPFKVRGYAHSTGGQVLSAGGVVISTGRLRRIVSDSPAAQRICVEGGTPWSEVVRYLRPRGRRPAVLTGNLLTSVAGTLTAGGVGSTSFVQGMQVATVTRLVVVLATGETVTLGPDDELFRYTLAGAGQLGIIVQAEFRTLCRPPDLRVWHFTWRSMADFCEAAARIRESGRFEVLGARFYFGTPSAPLHVTARAGVFCHREAAAASDPAGGGDRDGDGVAREVWDADRVPDENTAPEATQEGTSPALVFYLPLPSGLQVWERVVRDLTRAGLTAYMQKGIAITLLRSDRRYPLAPFPDSDECVFVALRTEVPRREVGHALAVLRRIAARVLEGGGKLDLTSIRPPGDFLPRQFGSALGRLRELKASVDPHGLLNPGLLDPESRDAPEAPAAMHAAGG